MTARAAAGRRTLPSSLMVIWLGAVVASLGATARAQAPAAEFLAPLPELASISHALPSPDGKWLACIVDGDGRSGADGGQLLLAAADGSGSHGITFAGDTLAAPAWSPDGRWLAYLRRAPGGVSELMITPSDGGDLHRLTDATVSVESFQWSPAGHAIAYLRAAPQPAPDSAQPEAGALVVGRNSGRRQLWLLPLDSHGNARPARRLSPEGLHVGSEIPAGAGAFAWAPRGREIAFTHTRSSAADDWKSADISIVDVTTGSVRPFQQSNAAEFSPSYSPDGRRIAFNITLYPPSAVGRWRVGTARTDGSGLKLLAATPDEQPRMLGWVTNRVVLVQESSGTVSALWKVPGDGGEPRRFDDGAAVLSATALNRPATRLAFVTMNDQSPPEVAVTGLRRFRPVTVSAINESLRSARLPETRLMRWAGADDQQIEGLLTLPPGHRPGTRHPLVLMIHDQPAGTFTRDYPAYARQAISPAALAAEGYAVLRANPRGAGGYGYEFRAASVGDWGGGDYADLMSGVDQVMGAGLADPERLAVVGWGHGGYVAARVITRTHRFSAAVLGAPMTDLVHARATSPRSAFIPDYLGGEFWEQEDVYRELSPLLQAHRITTPVLILHGEADQTVPAAQGLALYHTLARQGLDTRMVLYPRARHHLRAPAQRSHARGETLAWLARHLPGG